MQVVWGGAARLEFDSAIACLRAQSPAGAKRIGERILAVVELLERFPELAPASKHRGLRQLVVPRTPYLAIYRVHENRVEIRAVIDARRRRRR
jgi:plasmid stabilization system protein ParE